MHMAIETKGLSPLLQVFDMRTALAFYRDTLGFDVVADSGRGDESGWVMLRLQDSELMLNTQHDDDERPVARDPVRAKWHGDTCLYFACPDVDGAYEHLKSRGIPVEAPSIAPYGMKQLYVHDPDGYQLCFQWPTTA
jgi:glyoxylase I family protein